MQRESRRALLRVDATDDLLLMSPQALHVIHVIRIEHDIGVDPHELLEASGGTRAHMLAVRGAMTTTNWRRTRIPGRETRRDRRSSSPRRHNVSRSI